ncbi:integrase, partial [Pseudomonas syringae]
MNDDILEKLPWATIAAQPSDVRGLCDSERDKLIITAAQVEGRWVILSRYIDDTWMLNGLPSNVPASGRKINFSIIPSVFRASMKSIFYRYMMRGLGGASRPKGASIRDVFNSVLPFLRHLDALGIDHLGAVTPLIAATYVAASKAHRIARSGKPLTSETLRSRYSSIEVVCELSQYTDDPMLQHPWPGTSAKALSNSNGVGNSEKTPLIPDEVFCTLFERAHQLVEGGKLMLDIRDGLNAIKAGRNNLGKFGILWHKNKYLSQMGWEGGLVAFNKSLSTLRTACYIVLASTSGCRNHELANLQSGAHHRTEDDEGTIYHWMRSTSEKTGEGIHDWMIPEAGVRALRVMERWAAPSQAIIANEIIRRRRINPQDPEITEAFKHRHSLFLGGYASEGNQIRTLSNKTWGSLLMAFVNDCGLNWKLASHQFRRKFANYAAHSRFGDLRYLKEHYAHWSLDMTLRYAMDDSWGQHLDLDLHFEIQAELEDIKLGVVDNWMGDASLAGGYGRSIKHWQREPENLLIFKDRASMMKSISESTAIRSNGHAWCTADNDGCVGNSLERSRCSG